MEIEYKYLPEEDLYQTTKDHYISGDLIPMGFKFDGTTLPWWALFLRRWVPRIGKSTWAALHHDWCYKTAYKSKSYADKTYRKNLLLTGFSWFKSTMWYLGVVSFGRGSY